MKKISIAGQVISICPHFQSSFKTTRDPNRAHWISTFWFSEMSGIDRNEFKTNSNIKLSEPVITNYFNRQNLAEILPTGCKP